MKSCHNCRAIYDDEYNGTCTDCGANMALKRSGGQDLQFRYGQQLRYTSREGDNPRNVTPPNDLVNDIAAKILSGEY